jgi:hypothetical protein
MFRYFSPTPVEVMVVERKNSNIGKISWFFEKILGDTIFSKRIYQAIFLQEIFLYKIFFWDKTQKHMQFEN